MCPVMGRLGGEGCRDRGQRLCLLAQLARQGSAYGTCQLSGPLFPLACAEAQTFLASLRTALDLEPSATLEACANRLEQALADRCTGKD